MFYKTKINDKIAPQELFIERCLQLLKDGGLYYPKLTCMLLQKNKVFERSENPYIKKNNNIIAIIDLPFNTFRPFCGVKTCLIILQKNTSQQNNILMGGA
uniref:DNA methylase adenine-specific domain-containing protein n=1 Tax=Caulerpa verticillata TaxID=177082 RepID=A0A386B0D9_9CHLO|nr:hypothetical protein [Caulerpa verticillata]AYC65157.1 hypothetical protein [Caulerpa verticillata]